MQSINATALDRKSGGAKWRDLRFLSDGSHTRPKAQNLLALFCMGPRCYGLLKSSVLYQGTTLVVPTRTENMTGFSPCGRSGYISTAGPEFFRSL